VAVVPRALLGALRDAAFVVVQAPAGFGKTTTTRAALADEPGVAWYDGQPWDADAFLGPLVEQVRRVRPDAGRAALALADAGASPERYATAFAAELRNVEEPLRIVVDDAQVLGAGFAAFMRVLAKAAPAHVRLVVLTRAPLDLGVPEAVAAGRGALIDGETLRFDAAAAGALAAERGVATDAPRIAAILARTDGWPLATALALRGGADALLDELIARELHGFDAPTRALLDAFAVAETIELQHAQAHAPEAVALLRRAAAESPLLATTPQGFHIHPLLRDALLRELDPAIVAAQHRALTVTYAREGRLRAALFHLERARSCDADVAFLREHASAAIATGLADAVRASLRRVRAAGADEPALTAFVDAALAKAHGDDPRPDFTRAREAADARSDGALAFWSRLELVEADLARSEPVDAARIDELLARAPVEGLPAQTAAAARAGWADAVGGRFRAALRRLDHVADDGDERTRAQLAPLEAYAHLALGEFDAADHVVTAFVERSAQGPELGRFAAALVWAARFALLRGETAAAYEFAREAERVGRPLLVPANEAALWVTLAEASLHVGDVERARRAADAAARSAESAWYARDAARAGALARRTLARAWALDGDLARATAALDPSDPVAAADAAVFGALAGERAPAAVLRGRAALERFVPTDAADAVAAWSLAELLDFVDAGRSAARTTQLDAGPFDGLLARRFGETPFTRRVQTEHDGRATVELALARRLGAARAASLAPEAPPPPEALTAREREILTLLAAGLTNVEIAQRFTISARTVETHVARVIAKFGVNSRARAVARAIALGMVTVQ